MAIIFSFSSIPGSAAKLDIPYIDKLFHFVEYFILGAMLARAFSRSIVNPVYRYIFIASILIGSIYGATDEFHQRFTPGRSCDIFDLLSDIVGSGIGAALYTYKERLSECRR